MQTLRFQGPSCAGLLLAVLAGPGAWAQEQTGSAAGDSVEQPAKAEPAAVDDAAELAKKLNNPIASLISVPLKYSWDTGIDPGDRDRSTIIVQPVIPFELNADWNLITRTIIPYIDAESPAGSSDVAGTGDILQSFFFSPKAPTASGWIWGLVSQLLRFGKQPVSFALTYRYYLDTPQGGPDSGLSFTATLLFPK